MIRSLFAVGALSALVAAPAGAVLIVDQEGAQFVSGGLGTPLIQSFTPAENNIAGVDVSVSGTGSLTADLTVNLYDTYSAGSLSGLLASAFVDDVHRFTFQRALFSQPVSVTPETLYYLEFLLTDGALLIGTGSGNPYDRGAVLVFGGNPYSGSSDARFQTLFDTEFTPVPAPPALALFGLAALGLGLRRRKA